MSEPTEVAVPNTTKTAAELSQAEIVETLMPASYQLIATNGPQLEHAHAQMIDWARTMQARCVAESTEEEASLQVAIERHWSMAPRRRMFYAKIELALQAGYVIAKPALMSKTAEAMALKIFDEIGVAVDTKGRKSDPVIIGRIKNPRQRPDLSFFIGWFFNPADL